MPVYNTERYVAQAVESVLAQTYADWELIVVNDGSTDGSMTVVRSYDDSRISIIDKDNTGQADSRNKALSVAKGDYVAFLDSDDWYEPDFLALMLQKAIETAAEVVVCQYYACYKGGRMAKELNNFETLDAQTALAEVIYDKKMKSFLWDKLFRRDVLVEPLPIGRFFEDYLTVYKWIAHAKTVAFVQKPLYCYRYRKSSTDHNYSNPAKFYDFFLAELTRFNDITDSGLIPTLDTYLRKSLLECAIREMKKLARGFAFSEGVGVYAPGVVEVVKDFVSDSSMPLRNRVRLWLLMKAPRLFYAHMRLSALFSPKRKEVSLDKLYD